MEGTLSVISLIGSVFATGSTLYFWLLRMNRERPQLKIQLAGPISADTLAAGPGAPAGTARSQFSAKVIVANYSVLPNPVLGVRAWVKSREGTWETAVLSPDQNSQPPLNLPPLTVVPLSVTATITVPERPESAPQLTRREKALQSVADPVQVKLE